MIEARERESLHEQLWDWLEDQLPEPQTSSSGVRIALGSDHMTYDDNLAAFYYGMRFAAVVGVKFSRVLFLNEHYVDDCKWDRPNKDGKSFRYFFRDTETLNRLEGGIIAMRSNCSSRAVKRFRDLLPDPDLFPKPHARNKLITKYRALNALRHNGEKEAVTYHQEGDEVSNVVFWDSLDDAILERLKNNFISNVLEL